MGSDISAPRNRDAIDMIEWPAPGRHYAGVARNNGSTRRSSNEIELNVAEEQTAGEGRIIIAR
jgi:hypothetical protein